MSKTLPSPPAIRSTADFARYVGLARTTVSRVLNGQPGLKPKTIARVERAMEETGFTPNAYALHLKGKRTATVGICIENLLTPPAVSKLARLQRRLREHSYSSMIEVLEKGDSKRTVRHFLSLRVDAVAFLGHFNEDEITQRIAELKSGGIPHIVIDQAGIPGANSVSLDRVRAMEQLFGHLTGLRHVRFGLLGFSGAARSIRDRLTGVEKALASAGLIMAEATVSLDHLHSRENDFEFGRALAGSFLKLPHLPTALVALNDEIAMGAIHACRAAGLQVPHDMSVAGFNNQDICFMSTPTVTSIDQRIAHTAETAADLLLSQVAENHRATPLIHTIEPLLVVRESTGPARSHA